MTLSLEIVLVIPEGGTKIMTSQLCPWTSEKEDAATHL